ncbi:MAG: Tat pathway signal protein [Acidobacteriota bacterium]|jgi:hypothetical protein
MSCQGTPIAALTLAGLAVLGCGSPGRGDATEGLEASTAAARPPRPVLGPGREDPFLEDLQRRTFRFFWETTDHSTGLAPDRWPSESFSSVAAIGFALTAYPIGVERGWITRDEGRQRVLTTLDVLWRLPQGPEVSGTAGYRGFFYHFLHMRDGTRFERAELSTIDTALLMAGVLTCREYFSDPHPEEERIRTRAEELYRRVDWQWIRPRPPLIAMGWYPERVGEPGNGFHHLDWVGYDEAMLLYILALGSPTFPVDPACWPAYTSTYQWGSFHGFEHVGFAPLFGHFFSHIWIDFRGIQDAYMRGKGIDYVENSRRAALAQRAYARANPGRFVGYGEEEWGLSACDGPADVTLTYEGRPVRFFTYAARGASHTEVRDDGTITPYAAAASLPFAPEAVIPTLKAMHRRHGAHVYGQYGFLDAFNRSFTFTGIPLGHGRIVPGFGWVDGDYLGIDQGPIVAMIENYRSGLIWRLLRGNPYVVEGLRRAGFTGGWLEAGP